VQWLHSPTRWSPKKNNVKAMVRRSEPDFGKAWARVGRHYYFSSTRCTGCSSQHESLAAATADAVVIGLQRAGKSDPCVAFWTSHFGSTSANLFGYVLQITYLNSVVMPDDGESEDDSDEDGGEDNGDEDD
jgi:hypothetical protein